MNMISQIRQRINASGEASVSIDEFNQLQAEWITRCLPDTPSKLMTLAFTQAAADRNHVISCSCFRECFEDMSEKVNSNND